MPAALLPPDESQRLAILNRYAILDTFPGQQFDDLTFLAAQICQAPISLLSLIDRDRQWFKSHHGLEQSQIPRRVPFCAHTILKNEVFEVRDCAQDSRFSNHNLVRAGLKVRFYAGAPLITSEGFALGTLCVIDREPRQLSPDQRRGLQALAQQAMSQMELWRSFRQLEIASAERSVALSVAEETLTRLGQIEARFRQFMDNSPVLAFIKDEAGRFVYINAPFERTFKLKAAEFRGKTDFDYLPHAVAEMVRLNDRQVFESGRNFENIEVVPTPEGVQRDWLVFKFLIKEASGARLLGGVALDVSEQRRADRLKSEFVSVVSHELRTPLTSIRGALGLLAGGVAGEMSSDARQMIDIAQKNGDRLILLINDILDIEKIESGKMRFEVRPLALKSWLCDSVEQNRSYGVPLGVEIEVEPTGGNAEIEVMADENRLHQVLSNLLSNACKWTPRGGKVRVWSEIVGTRVRVSVRDQGPGVPADFVPRLFEKFGQADSSSTRQQGGTGLGLAISRAIVEKLGGKLSYIAPETGEKGATFRFDLPLCAPLPPDQASAEAAKSPGTCKILICEDDPEVAALLAALASQNGYQAEIAGTLAAARERLAQGNFCGLTLDLLLPDGDGLDLLRELREAANDLPVVVISAISQQGQLRGEALRVLDWLDKPLDAERLLAALDNFQSPEGAWLLHVEDDADVRRIVAAILGEETRIVAAGSLQEARQQLQRRRFDLVILDLSLRDGDALELVRELGAAEPPTPVILFSSKEPGREQKQLFAASLVKSRAGNDELRDTIRGLLGKKAAGS